MLDPGAAQREAGFHRYLAEFMGWQLPRARRFDGSETMLYLETVFPLLYIEQKAGWSYGASDLRWTLQPAIPRGPQSAPRSFR